MRLSRSDLLSYFQNLPNEEEERLVLVQHMSGWRTPSTEWSRYFANLYAQTGKYPGGMGSDWGHGQSSSDLLDWADILADYWDCGGIITVEAHLRNPWSGGDAWDQTGRNLADLYNPASAVYPTWIAMLDTLAVGFQALEDRGAVVLFRPWHEMTYTYAFWWSSVGYESDYKLAWQHMHDYLTTTKGLSNLLWVFSAADQGQWRPAINAYPGDSYVDLVGVDIYGSSTTIGGTDYEDLTGTGKPFCFGEVGGNLDASFDNHNIINSIRSNYPLTVYAMWWHDWNAPSYPNRASLYGCQGAQKSMYDYWTRCLRRRTDYLCYITHEVGDLTEYDSTENPDADLSVTVNAALEDTDYGLDVLIDDTTPIYGRANYSTSSKAIRARFHIDPNGMSFPSSLDNFPIFCFHRATGPPWCVGFVEFGIQNGSHWLRAVANFDNGVTTMATNRILITDAPHRCEVWVVRSSGSAASDGAIGIRVDDTVQWTIGIDNYDIWTNQDGCTIGAIWGIESGTSGRFFLDELAVIDSEIEIGASVTATMSLPDGDRTQEWWSTEVDHHDAVNFGWQQPGIAGESSYIQTSDDLQVYTDSFTLDSPAVSQYITEVEVWLLCHITDWNVSQLDVSLWNADESSQYGSTQTVDETPDSVTIDIPIYLPNAEGLWRSVTFSGLSLSSAQLANLVVRLEGRMCDVDACPEIRVFGLYTLHTLSGLTTSTSTTTSTTSTLTSTSTTSTSTSSSTSTSTTSTLTTTSTSTSTTSTVTTTSTTTTLGLTGGMAWGEENPTQGEVAASWQLWSDGAASVPTIDGDADWGKLDLDGGEEGRGPVCDFGNANPRRYIVTENRYGAGRESAQLQIRGSAAIFAQDDALPAWENYSVPVVRSWRYVQVREDR